MGALAGEGVVGARKEDVVRGEGGFVCAEVGDAGWEGGGGDADGGGVEDGVDGAGDECVCVDEEDAVVLYHFEDAQFGELVFPPCYAGLDPPS